MWAHDKSHEKENVKQNKGIRVYWEYIKQDDQKKLIERVTSESRAKEMKQLDMWISQLLNLSPVDTMG